VHVAQVVLAAATVLALVAVVTAIPTLLRVPADNDARAHLTGALVILTGGAAVTFAAYLADDLRCGHHCDRGTGPSGIASVHRWWHRHGSWQWSAQLTIAAAGLAVAALAFALAARRSRGARAPLWTARLVYLAWAGLVFAAPAAYELVKG
jgi:hypothetical protein